MSKINRRKFVQGGLVLSGALFTGFNPLNNQQKKVKIGVIGTGSRGNGLINLMNKSGLFDVVACADILPFRLKQGLDLAPKAKGFSDYKALLEQKDVEAVLISTPFSTHDEIAIDSIKAGKHIYCEKTMVKGLDEIQKVLDVKSNYPNLIFQTGHQYHSSELYKKVREIIKSGYIGEVTAYECQWNRNADWRRPVPDPKFERMINWRMYKEYSGGLAAELMSHQIDFINWVTGSHPSRVVGFGGIDHWDDGRETYDNAHVLFEYPSGLDATFICTTTNGYEDYGIKILGSKATIKLDYTSAVIYAEDLKERAKGLVDGVSGATLKAWKQGEGARIDAPGNDPTLDALKQFHSSIVYETEVTSTINSGALTAKCVQITNDALYSGEVKHWKDYPQLRINS